VPQHDRTTPIMPYDVERVLADIDADHGDCAVGFLGHGVLLVLTAPIGAGARPDHSIRPESLNVHRTKRTYSSTEKFLDF
jgi:hypothetical protein